jgi:hygromycin-B 7''-O-kinase
VREHGQGCADRHRAWGSLPACIVEGLEEYVVPPGPARLVHADLTAEHLFVHDGDLAGIIDWGDAMTTDPHYDLGPLHLGAFGADTTLLGAFLAGYGWHIDNGFARLAMSAATCHRHDLFPDLPPALQRLRTIDELAAALWDTTAG